MQLLRMQEECVVPFLRNRVFSAQRHTTPSLRLAHRSEARGESIVYDEGAAHREPALAVVPRAQLAVVETGLYPY